MNKITVASEIRKGNDSFVNGTNDREAYPKRWIAALVQMNCEKKVASKLDKLGITNYVPIQEETHQWSDRKKKIARVVIPMVVFVHLAQNEEDDFRKLPFILKFITYPGSTDLATPIPDDQIISLKKLLEKAPSQVSFESKEIHKGDKVKITNGALKDIEGYVIQENANAILVLEIKLLGYVKLKIDKTFLSLIDCLSLS